MAAYIIVDMKIADVDRYKTYTALTPKAIAAAGGNIVVRGGQHEVLEGDWHPARLVVVEFPTYAAAKAFYTSALYEEAKAKRAGATEFFNMIVVDGVGPA